MLHILLTFDYELFFGKNFKKPDEVLFQPAERIAEILYRHNVSGVFFADTCSVAAHKRYGLDDYVSKFEKQISYLSQVGHDVQLHIHPHWEKTTFEKGDWIFPENWYRIHDFGFNEDGAISIIKDGISFLKNTLLPINPNYQCIAYRAGGYCIQPYDELIEVLYNEGIRIDSSICMYKDNVVPARFYDYTKLPSALNWWLTPGVDIKDSFINNPNGKALFEVPVGYYHQRLIDRILLLNKVYYKHGAPLGEAMPTIGANSETDDGFITKLLTYDKQFQHLSLDSMSAELAYLAIKKLYKISQANTYDVYVAFVSHPKVFTGEAYDNLERFVNLIQQSSYYMDFASTIDINHTLSRFE